MVMTSTSQDNVSLSVERERETERQRDRERPTDRQKIKILPTAQHVSCIKLCMYRTTYTCRHIVVIIHMYTVNC